MEAPREEAAATVVDGAPSGADPPPVEGLPFVRIGRYTILRRLAEGAMGAVYVAYDEHLDRRVAIKVVRAMGQRSADVYERMLREAQGLARLSHPNVVQIYEADVVDGRVYLVMEYIEGETLRTWCREPSRTRAELLRRCVEAGRGLAAAHRAGLIHRDFKPDNVMVGVDGRVRVLDFGLVRADGEAPGGDAALRVSGEGALRSSSSSWASEITVAHTLIGTPAYMSPEQHMRQPADVRSDIFAFAVVLYEALLGVRPFAGKEQGEIMRAVLSQRLCEPADGRRLPRWLHRAILRGLAIAPADRWQSMDELLAALDRDPARTRRRWLAGLGLAAGLAAGGGAIAWAIHGEAQACRGADEEIAAVWGEGQARALADAFAASGVGYAGDVASRAQAALDDYAAAWAAVHHDACVSHRRGESSGERLDARMACLGARRRDLAAVVEALRAADAEVIERALPMIHSLEAPSACVDAAASPVRAPQDPEAEAIGELLARAQAEERAGRFALGLQTIAAAEEAARGRGDPELDAQIQLQRGRLLREAGSFADAQAALEDAYYGALAIADERLTILGAIELVRLGARTHAEPAVIALWLRAAEAHARRAGTDAQRADFHAARAEVRTHIDGDYEGALADYEEALRRRREVLPPRHPDLVVALRGVGATLFKRGDNAQARGRLEEAQALAEEALGPGHPRVADIVANLALIAAREGRLDEAVGLAERALQIREGAVGLRHPSVADNLSNLGELELRRGRPLAAIAHLERAAAIAAEAYGDDHPRLALYLGSLGVALYKAGRLDDALAVMERALARSEAGLGGDHPNTAIFRANLGEALNDRGEHARAHALIRAALTTLEARVGASGPDLGPIYRELARALLGLGDDDAAIAAGRRGLALIAGATQVPADERAKTAWVLAQALSRRPADRDEALTLAREARAELASRAPGEVTLLAAIDAWLAARDR